MALHSSLTRRARQRNIAVPQYLNITYGEPYDTLFAKLAREEIYPYEQFDPEALSYLTNNLIPPVNILRIYILLNHPLKRGPLMLHSNIKEGLVGFILGIYSIPKNKKDKALFNSEVLVKLGYSPLKFEYTTQEKEFRDLLFRLKPIDIVYIAIVLGDYNLNIEYTSLSNYIDYFRDNYREA